MSWVTIIWSMTASACLTAAAIYFLVWCKNRSAWANLWFAVAAASTTAYTFCELSVMRAQTPADLVAAMRWAQLAYFFLITSITWFVYCYLRAGRLSLAWTITGLRFFYVALTFGAGINVNYLDIPSVERIQFLGESVAVLAGTPNPLTLFGQSVVLLLLVFVADASRTAWRRGDRRQALTVGGAVVFFIVTGLVSASIVLWGNVRVPLVVSLCYLVVVAVMAYELSRDVLRAAQLARELQAAERETQQLRHEIAHAQRISMMGQLATGLAHEINQPLAAILRNAEAGELFLQQTPPDLDEIRTILAEIRMDDERAGHVIDRMRGLLKRQVLETQELEMTTLVGDVAKLVRVDAATRQVKLSVAIPDVLPQVLGNRVQIQQVLLNLVLNGMDALSVVPPEKRRLSVTARRDGAKVVEVAVDDEGLGVPADALARIFDPFFTTKANGMGMGLAISRTIVEAHGGRLWAENRSAGGASFRFVLPVSETAAVL